MASVDPRLPQWLAETLYVTPRGSTYLLRSGPEEVLSASPVATGLDLLASGTTSIGTRYLLTPTQLVVQSVKSSPIVHLFEQPLFSGMPVTAYLQPTLLHMPVQGSDCFILNSQPGLSLPAIVVVATDGAIMGQADIPAAQIHAAHWRDNILHLYGMRPRLSSEQSWLGYGSALEVSISMSRDEKLSVMGKIKTHDKVDPRIECWLGCIPGEEDEYLLGSDISRRQTAVFDDQEPWPAPVSLEVDQLCLLERSPEKNKNQETSLAGLRFVHCASIPDSPIRLFAVKEVAQGGNSLESLVSLDWDANSHKFKAPVSFELNGFDDSLLDAKVFDFNCQWFEPFGWVGTLTSLLDSTGEDTLASNFAETLLSSVNGSNWSALPLIDQASD